MDHNEAVKQMAVERYLLKELTPDERDAFEEHLFDCPECAVDLRAGAAFVQEAKAQLPTLTASLPAAPSAGIRKPSKDWRRWFSWWRSAMAVPAFAALLLVVGYQNLVTFPALRASVDQPHLLFSVPMHGATRGADHLVINADRSHGFALPFDFYRDSRAVNYASYSFDLYDPQGKLAWTGAITVPDDLKDSDQRISLAIPGAKLRDGTYRVIATGIAPNGERTEVERQVFDLHVSE
jgi:hypothetical protein